MIKVPRQTAVGNAHSKLILVGEHAVVYGKPAIALPFSMIQVKSLVEASQGLIMIDSSFYQGSLSGLPSKMQGIAVCIKETLNKLGQPHHGLTIKIDSTIPIGRGLGSSAAIAVAIVRSLYAYYNRKLSQNDLMELVHLSETYAHGKPSGIDMATVASDKPIWFRKNEEVESVVISQPIHIVVADSGRIGDTHAAVKSIRDMLEKQPEKTMQSIDKLEEITSKCRDILADGDHKSLGLLLDLAQNELKKLGVSDQGIEKLVQVAKNAGALGAKLTGGGRGGCILALAKDAVHAKKLANVLLGAGANKTWRFSIGEN